MKRFSRKVLATYGIKKRNFFARRVCSHEKRRWIRDFDFMTGETTHCNVCHKCGKTLSMWRG